MGDKKIIVIVLSHESGRQKEKAFSPKELIEMCEKEIVEKITECDCQPVGETNVIDCNCSDEWEDYSISTRIVNQVMEVEK